MDVGPVEQRPLLPVRRRDGLRVVGAAPGGDLGQSGGDRGRQLAWEEEEEVGEEQVPQRFC